MPLAQRAAPRCRCGRCDWHLGALRCAQTSMRADFRILGRDSRQLCASDLLVNRLEIGGVFVAKQLQGHRTRMAGCSPLFAIACRTKQLLRVSNSRTCPSALQHSSQRPTGVDGGGAPSAARELWLFVLRVAEQCGEVADRNC